MLQRDRDDYSHNGIRGESMDINILHMVPKFLLRDPNGYALAKAIEAAMAYYAERVEAGIDAVTNPDKMPEWRLDEMAWEKGCMYGYDASLEAKRDWIKNAGAYCAVSQYCDLHMFPPRYICILPFSYLLRR